MNKKQIIICIKSPLHDNNSNSNYVPLYKHDLQVIKIALQLKSNYNYNITAISADIGKNNYSTEDTLRNVLFTGIDNVISIKPKNIITYNDKNYYYKHIIIGYMLSECIKNLNNYDIILYGNKSVNNNISKINTYLSSILNVFTFKVWDIEKIIYPEKTHFIEIYYKDKNFIKSIQLPKQPILLTVMNSDSNINIIKMLSAKNIIKYNKIKSNEELQKNKLNIKTIYNYPIIQEYICDIKKEYLDKFPNKITIKHNKTKNLMSLKNKKIIENINEQDIVSILDRYTA